MQNIFIELLPPWVETGLQPAFYDKESGTVLQQVSRMYAKINQLIGSVNNQNTTIADYIQKFIDLKDYVDTYFNNLDVQSEINNKLDQMASSGQLANIIAQYLQAQAVFGFDTIAEMSASENLANGAICKVLGKTNYQTGDGAFYKIRTITSDDVIDGVNKVKITHDNTLIAELITDYNFDKLNSYVDVIFPKLSLTNIDSTQGSSVILTDGTNSAIIDTFQYADDYVNVKNALTNAGITTLNAIFISHYHIDHFNNLEQLLTDFGQVGVTKVYLPRLTENSNLTTDVATYRNAVLATLNSLGYTYITLDNEEYTVGDNGFTIRAMNASSVDFAYYDALNVTDYNEYSVGFECLSKGKKFLYTADWGENAQNRCAKLYVKSSYDIVTAPHHGLSYLSSDLFNMVDAKTVIVSVGKGWFVKNDTNAVASNCAWASASSKAGKNVIFIGYQTDNITYKMSVQGVNTSDKVVSAQNISIFFGQIEYFVDSTSTKSIRNGSKEYPFVKLKEALALSTQCDAITINIVNCDSTETGIRTLSSNHISINANNKTLPNMEFHNSYVEIKDATLQKVNLQDKSTLILRSTSQHQNNIVDSLEVNNSKLIIMDSVNITASGSAISSYRGEIILNPNSFNCTSEYAIWATGGFVSVGDSVKTWLLTNPCKLFTYYTYSRVATNVKASEAFVLYESSDGVTTGTNLPFNITLDAGAKYIGIVYSENNNRSNVVYAKRVNNGYYTNLFSVGFNADQASTAWITSGRVQASSSAFSIDRNAELTITSGSSTFKASTPIKVFKIFAVPEL